jgi:CheY-like chemotaxis protein/HPt (histidine-containing phosphotransfer) domain-containing protein
MTENLVEQLQERLALLEEENRKLRFKADRADSVSKAKSGFLAMVSHEIRTPINGVIGITNLLLQTELDDRQRHYADLVATSATNLLSLINNLLDFSKIEAEKLVLEKSSFDLQELIKKLLSFFELTAKTQGIKIVGRVDPAIKTFYYGDDQRIRQVLVNLVGNAIKFSGKGTVEVRLELIERDGQNDNLHFSVTDQGRGIEQQHLKTIFQPFFQSDSSNTRRYGGTGLGLAISQSLVEMMNGTIGVESVSDHGSTFWFDLQLPWLQADDGQETSGATGSAMIVPGIAQHPTLLIVDDEKINRMIFRETLSHSNIRVETAASGQEALSLCKARDFDMIFMDCRMPVKNGFTTTKEILAHRKALEKKAPVIVALTADTTKETRERCMQAGMVDYMTKPLEFSELQRVLNNWLPTVQLRRPQVHYGEDNPEQAEFSEAKMVHINYDRLKRLRESVGDISPIIKVFIDAMSGRVRSLEEAAVEDDYQALKLAAHRLKGSSRQLGAEYLAGLCQQLEHLANAQQAGQVDAVLGQIKRTGEQVVDLLSKELRCEE